MSNVRHLRMRSGNRLGAISLALASLAIALAIVGMYAESVQGSVSGYLLRWLDAHGLVRSPRPSSVPVMASPGLLVITDQIATCWLMFHSWWFAVCAIAFALWAEVRREN